MLNLVTKDIPKEIETFVKTKRSLRHMLCLERQRLSLLSRQVEDETTDCDIILFTHIETLRNIANKLDQIQANMYHIDKKIGEAGLDASKYF